MNGILGPGIYDDQGRFNNHLIPTSPNAFDVGSATLPIRNLYLAGSTVITGNQAITGNLSVGGTITMTAAASQLIPGATSFAIRNNANGANNLLISNAGLVTARAGLVATAGGVTATAGAITATNGNFVASTIGTGLQVKRGANAKGGTFTATADTPVVVSNTSVTTESVISISLKTVGGTPAAVFMTAISAGASFTVNSAAGNTSVYNYVITELIP